MDGLVEITAAASCRPEQHRRQDPRPKGGQFGVSARQRCHRMLALLRAALLPTVTSAAYYCPPYRFILCCCEAEAAALPTLKAALSRSAFSWPPSNAVDCPTPLAFCFLLPIHAARLARLRCPDLDCHSADRSTSSLSKLPRCARDPNNEPETLRSCSAAESQPLLPQSCL